MTSKTPEKGYSHTVNLPQTAFPMKGNLPSQEPGWQKFWQEKNIYGQRLLRSLNRSPFVLHDGPPYANGHIHIGHALNKILKDMVVKSQALMGRQSPYIPGWDCHGLPIEHALLKEMKISKREVRDLGAFRRQAQAFAERFISMQREEFKRLGILGAWEEPYTTMSKNYEAVILRAFRLLYKGGYIYRGLKTVSWCIACETALAEAEVEYKEKKSPSVYVSFPVTSPSHLADQKAEVLIWTTTPWTLPANQAVAFHPELEYVLVEALTAEGSRRLLLARSRLEAVLGDLKAKQVKELAHWQGRELVSPGTQPPYFQYQAPFGGRNHIAVLADYVSSQEGTGIVHTAPGHGMDDFETGKNNHLEIFCPVDGSGHFTAEAGQFQGRHIFGEGNSAVLAALKKFRRLLGEFEITHNYPHCWRCKNPIAFRATEQWFLRLNQDFREKLLKAIEQTHWIPQAGQSRISAMVTGRPDWCLSRQRLWGTPIPMLRCAKCRTFLDEDGVLEAIVRRVEKEGSDFWFERWGEPVHLEGPLRWDFLPPKTACAKCESLEFQRETDILDVWVDSGASWLAVLEPRSQFPCDLYLEGSDQHRGWFQSSLVLSVALSGRAPYRTVLTHGFVLDEKGRAMHKSLGNVVSPQQVIEKLGADVLRLWVALADYSDDVRISDKLLEGPTETYRKIRNTFRYLLGNVCDFDPASPVRLEYARMPELERYILKRLWDMERQVRMAYEAYEFRKAATGLVDFCNLDLSAFYLDVRKDALYTLKRDDPLRRAAQFVMWECLSRLVLWTSPILSFTCEEAWQQMRRLLKEELGSSLALAESVFLEGIAPAPETWDDSGLSQRWGRILKYRELVLQALERQRALKVIGSSLQAKVLLEAEEDESYAFLTQVGTALWSELTMVSQFEIRRLSSTGDFTGQGDQGVTVYGEAPKRILLRVQRTEGTKCARCWRYTLDVGSVGEHPNLCRRCIQQLTA